MLFRSVRLGHSSSHINTRIASHPRPVYPHQVPISFEHILNESLNALISRANQLDTEQAVQGLDALQELQLHDLIEHGFTNAALGTHREAHYPSTGDAYTKSTHRPRCDFALTQNPDLKLLDPATELKQLALAQDTLFATTAQPDPDPTTTCTPEDAWWIEIKTDRKSVV